MANKVLSINIDDMMKSLGRYFLPRIQSSKLNDAITEYVREMAKRKKVEMDAVMYEFTLSDILKDAWLWMAENYSSGIRPMQNEYRKFREYLFDAISNDSSIICNTHYYYMLGNCRGNLYREDVLNAIGLQGYLDLCDEILKEIEQDD